MEKEIKKKPLETDSTNEGEKSKINDKKEENGQFLDEINTRFPLSGGETDADLERSFDTLED